MEKALTNIISPSQENQANKIYWSEQILKTGFGSAIAGAITYGGGEFVERRQVKKLDKIFDLFISSAILDLPEEVLGGYTPTAKFDRDTGKAILSEAHRRPKEFFYTLLGESQWDDIREAKASARQLDEFEQDLEKRLIAGRKLANEIYPPALSIKQALAQPHKLKGVGQLITNPIKRFFAQPRILKGLGRGLVAAGGLMTVASAYLALQTAKQAHVEDGNKIGVRTRRAISDGVVDVVAGRWSPDITGKSTEALKAYAQNQIASPEKHTILG